MAFTLYDGPFPGTRGTRVRWMLEEAGEPYEISSLDFREGEHKRDAYLSLHPHGLVPAAKLDGIPLIESAAMCLHLADTHPEANLAPAVGTFARAQYYQWCAYAIATLDAPLVSAILNAMVFPEPRRDPTKVEAGKKVWDVAGPFLEKQLDGKSWLLGEQFTTADVVLGYDVRIAAVLGWIEKSSALGTYAARLSERPAFKRAYGS
jgi:glutathione S-transferase